MPPPKRNENEDDPRWKILTDVVDRLSAEVRKNSDSFLVLNTKFIVYGSVLAVAGGVVGAILSTVVGGAILWYLKKP